MEIHQRGYQDIYFDKFKDVISIGRPTVLVKNLVIGTLYVDVAGQVDAINHKTKETCVVKFNTRGWSSNSSINGSIMDKSGKEHFKLEGSWWDELYLVDCSSKKRELIWKQKEPVADHLKMFGFNNVAINLNFISEELKQLLAPTDTRLRGDQRLFEQGKVDEADEEKIRLEVKQRKARKIRHDEGLIWQPNFFKEI
jgi:hypothetical protein